MGWGAGGGQLAADSQVVRRRLDNSDWLLLKMEDELIEARGVCDLKGWGTALRAECIFRSGGVIPSWKQAFVPELVNEQQWRCDAHCCSGADVQQL